MSCQNPQPDRNGSPQITSDYHSECVRVLCIMFLVLTFYTLSTRHIVLIYWKRNTTILEIDTMSSTCFVYAFNSVLCGVPARQILSTSSLQTSSMWLRRWHRARLAPLKASVGRLRAAVCRPAARGTQSSGAAWAGKDREWKIHPGMVPSLRQVLPFSTGHRWVILSSHPLFLLHPLSTG